MLLTDSQVQVMDVASQIAPESQRQLALQETNLRIFPDQPSVRAARKMT